MISRFISNLLDDDLEGSMTESLVIKYGYYTLMLTVESLLLLAVVVYYPLIIGTVMPITVDVVTVFTVIIIVMLVSSIINRARRMRRIMGIIVYRADFANISESEVDEVGEEG